MKNKFYFALFVLLMAVGCQKEIVMVEPEVVDPSESIFAEIEQRSDVDTKTYIDHQRNVCFHQGDQIALFRKNTLLEKFKLDANSAGQTSGVFNKVEGGVSGTGNALDAIIAYYPYSSIQVESSGNPNEYLLKGIQLPATQNYNPETILEPNALPMVSARGADEEILRFKNLCGVLKLNIKGSGHLRSITLKGNNGEKICGDATVSVKLNEAPVISMENTAADQILLDCGNSGVALEQNHAKEFMIVLPPTVFEKGFTVILTDVNGEKMEMKSDKNQSVPRAFILNMPEIIYQQRIDKTKIELTEREMRGVWLTTVWNLDWPTADSRGNASAQKAQLLEYLDLFEELNINAVFFQVRGMADALYESQYEPWSRYVTGAGNQPAGWNPIQFAIDEGHKRGIQIHAWMNPYRIATRSDASVNFYPALDSRIPKEWVKDYDLIRMYNPGLPEVRQRIADIVKEILTKYPGLDGIHFDDYFYPETSACSNLDDQKEYEQYHKAGQSIDDWRFENVNQMVQLIRKTVKNINPAIAFTISPAGNMQNNMGYLHADIQKWCQNQWVDAIIPQLYWGRKYFDPRLKEFCNLSGSVPIYVGYNTNELYNDFAGEYQYASTFPEVKGSVHYRAAILKSTAKNIVSSAYKSPRICPTLAGNANRPAAPYNVSLHSGKLTWEGMGTRFAIYKDDATTGSNLGKSATIVGLTGNKEFSITEKGTYYITALDERCVESLVSDPVTNN